MTLSCDQEQAVATILAKDGPFFLTGEAGSGKSFLIEYFKKEDENYWVSKRIELDIKFI